MGSVPRGRGITSVLPGHGTWSSVFLFLAVVSLVLFSTSDAEARRRGRGRSGASAAARKKQMIASLQRRLVVAQQVLVAAEGQAYTSQAKLSEALSKLSEIRSATETDEQEAAEAEKELHVIEDKVLDKSSLFQTAQESYDSAISDLQRAIYQVLPQLKEQAKSEDESFLLQVAKLSSEERQELEADSDYRAATKALRTETHNLAQVRMKVLQGDPEWVTARKEATELAKKRRELQDQARLRALDGFDNRKSLRNASRVAAEARLVVNQCESLLGRLGAKSGSKTKRR